MKRSMRTMFVLLAIVMSLVAVQATWAQDTVTVDGTVSAINTAEKSIQVDEGEGVITTVYCIPFDYLDKKFDIEVQDGLEVTIVAYERTFSDGSVKLIAISLNDVNLPGARKAGK